MKTAKVMPTAPRQQGERKVVPAGNHVARLYQSVQIGTVQEEYQGEEKMMPKIRLSWELPLKKDVFKDGEEPKPFAVHQEYTLSMGPKANLRKIVEGMIGAALTDNEAYAFEINDLIGKACLLNVVQKVSKSGNTYAVVKGTSPLPEGMEAPVAFNAPIVLDYQHWDDTVFNGLPGFIKEQMQTTPEYDDMLNPKPKKKTAKIKHEEGEVDPEEVPKPTKGVGGDIPF